MVISTSDVSLYKLNKEQMLIGKIGLKEVPFIDEYDT
ncbi:hypothetical protein SAMN04488055_4424 [Chitinophaga niabensis]|uniref:Uncharacterized protein n=1 Tax=Chitinophaga niabensis TaxID=536979 RepID=A0A1N6JU95_9BACT|nr:hypothetical protein SAMN04488055_4424 [Chitinophaga niabensis]